MITVKCKGEECSVPQAAKKLKVSTSVIYYRLKHGIPIDTPRMSRSQAGQMGSKISAWGKGPAIHTKKTGGQG